MASDAEIDLLVNATRTLPELERDLARVISTAERNADDIDLNTVVDVRDSIDSTLRDLDRVRRAAEAGADDIDLLAVLDQIESLTGMRSDVDNLVTQVANQAPDIDLTAVIDRTRSLSRMTRDLNAVVRTAQARVPDIDVNVRTDSDDADVSMRRFTRTLSSATQTALSAGTAMAATGARMGALGVAAGAAVPLVAGFVAELANIVPAAAVAASAMLTVQLASGTLKLALQGVDDAITAVFDPDADPEKLAQALERLAPNARKFVQELQKMRAPLREIQQRVQNRFFAGFDSSLRDLSRAVLPSVSRALDDTADSLNRMARGAAEAATDLGESGILGKALKSSTRSLENLEGIPGQIVAGLGRIAAAAGPSLERITSAVADKADEISESLARAFETGDLQRSIEDAIDVIRQLGRIGGNVLGGLRNIFGGLTQDGSSLFDGLEKITEAFEELTGTDEAQEFFGAVADVARELREALEPLLPILGELAKDIFPILTRVLSGVADLFDRLAPVVEEIAEVAGGILSEAFSKIADLLDRLIPKFQELAEKFGPKLNEFWERLRPLLEEAGVAFGEVLEELGPIIEDMLELTFILAEKLLPIVGGVLMIALMAFIGVLRLLREVFELLQPVIENIARVFRGDFDGALRGSLQLTDRAVGTIKRLFSDMKERVVQTIRDLATQQLAAFRDMFFRVTTAVGEFLNRLFTAFSKIPGIVRDATGDLGGILIDAGADIVRGLISGMQSQLGRLRDIASQIAQVVSGTVKDILKISSPSREFRDIGDDTIQGFIDGLRRAAPGLEDEMRRITAEFQAAAPSGDDTGFRFSVPPQAPPRVHVYVGGEELDRRIVTISDRRIHGRERDLSQGVRT